MSSVLERLKQRKLVQWALAYLAGAWVLLQVFDLLSDTYGWHPAIMRSVPLLLGIGLFATLVLAWYHGEKGAQSVSGPELLMLSALLVVAGGVVWLVGRDGAEVGDKTAQTQAQSGQVAFAGAAPIEHSIAVLPFANLSTDEENEYFADGITEELLNALAKLDGLKVAARTSSFVFKGRNVPIDSVARALNVAHVLEGSVRKAGSRVRITAQLIEAENGYHLWSETYDRELKDIFAVQEDIARAITDALQIRLAGLGTAPLVTRPTEDIEAYELYLKGRYHWNLRTDTGLRTAVKYFEQALNRDPTYAQAYAGLADAYSLLGYFGDLPPKEAYPKARSAAERALRLDPTLAEAHTSLAYLRMVQDFDWEGAERGFRRALALQPNYATAHHWYAFHLLWTGQIEEALREIQRATELDPLSPAIEDDVWHIRYFARQYDTVIEHFRKLPVDERMRVFPLDHYLPTLVEKGLYEEAIAEFRKWQAANDEPSLEPWLAYPYARMGRRAEALQLLGNRLENCTDGPCLFHTAQVYTALGEKDRAFEWLEWAYEKRDSFLTYLKIAPGLDPLRSDPRFTALLRKVGLE